MKKKKLTKKTKLNFIIIFFKNFLKLIVFTKFFLKQFIQQIFSFIIKNYRFFEFFQLTIIYFFALIQLTITCLQMSGSVPELYRSLPFFDKLISSPLIRFFTNTDKTYILYLLVQELVISRAHIFRFSLIVRYNLLYLMTLEFIFYWIMNWWDILCNFENDLILKTQIDKVFATEFYLTLFFIYFILYLYSYIRAISRKLPVFPLAILQKIPDSVAFLLQIKQERKIDKNKNN